MPLSYARLALGVALTNVASGVLYAVLPLVEVSLGGGTLLATLIIALPLLAQTLASFLWGALSDRLGSSRKLLLGGLVGEGLLFLGYPFLPSVALLVVRIAQAGLAAVIILASALATGDDRRSAGRNLGGLGVWGSVGSVVGLLVALPLVMVAHFELRSALGYSLLFVLAACTIAAALVFSTAGEVVRATSRVPWRHALRFPKGSRVLAYSVSTIPLAVGNYLVYSVLPLYVDDVLGRGGFFGVVLNGTSQVVIFTLAAAAAGVPVSTWIGNKVDRVAWRRRMIALTPLVYASLWFAFASTTDYGLVLLLWSLPVFSFLSIALIRELAAESHLSDRGRAIGLWSATYNAGGVAGGVIAGLTLGSPLSFRSLFILAGSLDLVTALAYPWILRGGFQGSPGEAPSLGVK